MTYMHVNFAAIKQNENQVLRDKTEYVLSQRKAKTLASVQGFPFAYQLILSCRLE